MPWTTAGDWIADGDTGDMAGTLSHLLHRARSAKGEILQVLAFGLGILLGASVGIAAALQWRADAIPFDIGSVAREIPTVVIEHAADGRFQGRVSGSARLLLGHDLIAAGSGTFAGTMGKSLPVVVEVVVPPGMLYVASREGKKYYAVDSAMGNRLAPKNRVYFPDRASAEAAGYKP